MERDKLQTYCKKWYNTIKNMTAPENPHNVTGEPTVQKTVHIIKGILAAPFIIGAIIVLVMYVIPGIGRLTSAILGYVPFGTDCNTTKYCCEIPSAICEFYGIITILITLIVIVLCTAVIAHIADTFKTLKKSYDYAVKMVETDDCTSINDQ